MALVKIDFSERNTLPKAEKKELSDFAKSLDDMSIEELLILDWGVTWRSTARRKQLPPPEFLDNTKPIWGLRSGRGFGKTLTAANWQGLEACLREDTIHAVIAPTHDDARHTCFEGVTGLLNVIPEPLIVDHNKALPSITLYNGSFIRGFAGDTPNRLRGPQYHTAWCEEIASWQYPKEAWSNIEFGLRLGKSPRMVWTSTPRPTPFMRDRNGDKRAIVVSGSTYENRANLTGLFYDNVAKYEGTAIGRQELWGELLDPEEAGFVKRSQWRLWSAKKPLPRFRFLIMSLDTAFTDKTHDKKTQTSDFTACSVWGMFEHEKQDHVMLLDCWEDRLGFPQLVARVKKEKKFTYGDQDEPLVKPLIKSLETPRHQGRPVDLILIEEKGSGISLRQSLASENIFTESYNPGKLDKLSRLHIVSPMFAAGRVWAVESESQSGQPRTFMDPLISQVCSFVGEGSVEYDDLLDTATQALRLIMDKFRMVFTVKVDPEELKRRLLAEKYKSKRVINPYAE